MVDVYKKPLKTVNNVSAVAYCVCLQTTLLQAGHAGTVYRICELRNMPRKILILGHSLVRRFEQFVSDNQDRRLDANLNLDCAMRSMWTTHVSKVSVAADNARPWAEVQHRAMVAYGTVLYVGELRPAME